MRRTGKSFTLERAEALRSGATRYRDGRPCPKGHVNVERYASNGACVECCREAARAQRAEVAQRVAALRAASGLDGRAVRRERVRDGQRAATRAKVTRSLGIETGAPTYHSTTPCIRGHVNPERYTKGGGCVLCAGLSRAWRDFLATPYQRVDVAPESVPAAVGLAEALIAARFAGLAAEPTFARESAPAVSPSGIVARLHPDDLSTLRSLIP